jgi:hypothetical protein
VTADVRRTPRRGTSSASRHKAHALDTAQSLRVSEDASFARSFDPCTSILTMHRGESHGGGATGRHHGWANPRRWEEPSLGSVRTDVARLAARHRSSQEERRVESKKRKEIEVSVPARIKSSRFGCSHVVVVAEVGRRRLASNKLGKRAPKRAVRVE